MNKLKIKKEIFETAKSLIKKKKADFEEEINRLRQNGKHQELDQNAQDDASQEIVNKLNSQFDFAHQQLLHLNRLEGYNRILDRVQPGAIVITHRGAFFISVATSHFEVNGIQVIGMSPDAPIYKVMNDKKKGDRFIFNGNDYDIEDLF